MATSLCGASGYENTGNIDCDVTRGNPKMLLVGGATFSSSDYGDPATMDAAILSKLKLQSGNSQKLFPFPVIQGTSDKTEAAKFASFGYGLQVKMVGSKPGYEFQVVAGSSLEKKLKTFDGKTVPIEILDDKSQIWGVKDSASKFTGAKWQLSFEPHGFGDAQNVKATTITISMIDAADMVENAFVYTTGLATSSLTGLKDVNMIELSHSTNVYKIKFKIPTALLNGDLDIYDDYGVALAALTFFAFTGVNYATSLAITSVAVDATLKALTVTFDSTAFTALAPLTKIKLVAPIVTVLDAADVTGIEIASLIITKP